MSVKWISKVKSDHSVDESKRDKAEYRLQLQSNKQKHIFVEKSFWVDSYKFFDQMQIHVQ